MSKLLYLVSKHREDEQSLELGSPGIKFLKKTSSANASPGLKKS